MTKHKVLVATYDTVDTAQDVARKLVIAGCERGDIGVAARDLSGSADGDGLLAVSVGEHNMEDVAEMVEAHEPLVMDTRDIQWRQDADWLVGIPDTTNFSAVPLADEE